MRAAAFVLGVWVCWPVVAAWARPVRVEGDPRWWLEISRAWERFNALRSYRARGDLSTGGEVIWEVVRGRQPAIDDLRMVVTGRDSQGGWRQETVQKGGHEVWQVSWIPKKAQDPRRIRETERALESMGRRMAPDARPSVRSTQTHHILCVRVTRPVFITPPGSEFRRPLAAARVSSRRRGTYLGPDRVVRPAMVYEYRLMDPRTGEWTTPITLAVDERTGLPVHASYHGYSGTLLATALLRIPGRDRVILPAIVAYYDHDVPFTIATPPRACRR